MEQSSFLSSLSPSLTPMNEEQLGSIQRVCPEVVDNERRQSQQFLNTKLTDVGRPSDDEN